ncbi:MAG: cytochrome c [Octadecabacter sp.]|nr:cytochrome c [Octadecabacter sp.]
MNRKFISLLLAPLALAACVEQEEVDTSMEAGAVLFAQDCAACHGDDGKGAGNFGTQLFTIPPDLTTLSAQAGGVFPRDYIMGVIDGFDRGDHFSGAMPEFGAGDLGPTVNVEVEGLGTPVPSKLLALAAYIESIQE